MKKHMQQKSRSQARQPVPHRSQAKQLALRVVHLWRQLACVSIVFALLLCFGGCSVQQHYKEPEEPKVNATEIPKVEPKPVAKGSELLAKAVAACGGAEAFAKIENFVIKAKITVITPQGEMQVDSTYIFVVPDKLQIVITMPMGEIKQVITQDQAWAVTPQGIVDIPESQRKDMQASIFRDWINLFRISQSESLDVQYLGTEEVDGAKAEIILVTDDKGNSVKLFLDAKTFVPLKEAYKGNTMVGPADLEEFYFDVRDVSDIKLPFYVLVKANGNKYLESKTIEIKFNTEIDPGIFDR